MRERFRALLARGVEGPLVSALARMGVGPNALTLTGLLLSALSALLAGLGLLTAGGLVFLLAGALDMLDGSLARRTGRATPLGAFLDSTLDRLGEALFLVGLGVFGALRYSGPALVWFTALLVSALALGQMVSYIRARGESLGVEARLGVMTRPERVVVLGVGTAVGYPLPALAVVALLSAVTSLQRWLHVARSLRRADP